MLVDSHSHIDGDEFEDDRTDVLRRARAVGIEIIVVIGTGDAATDNHLRAVKLAETHAEITADAPQIYAVIGVHPHDANSFTREAEAKLMTLAGSNRVIAWGEIGLDYHYDFSPRAVQRDVFVRQLEIARQLDLPIVIHTREADKDTYDVLQNEYGATKRGGVMHCFSGDVDFAKRMIDLNFMISLAGIVTFRKSEMLQQVAREIPLECLLVETDAPYLAPVPFRGKRNEPAYAAETARFIARLRGLEFEEFARATTENFKRFFKV